MRDLGALLNTPNLSWRQGRAEDAALAAQPDIDAFPAAAASVVNYGIPPLSGRTGLDPEAVAADLAEAIRRFEPRLRSATVKVQPSAESPAGHAIAFDIEAELWSDPDAVAAVAAHADRPRARGGAACSRPRPR